MSPPEFPFWNVDASLTLASASVARRTLLESCRIPFSVKVPDIDERSVEQNFLARGGTQRAVARHLAGAKAVAAGPIVAGAYALGADQVLIVEGSLLHKPRSRAEAEATLHALSGRTHELISAYAIASEKGVVQEGEDSAFLTMRPLSGRQIGRYLDHVGDRAMTSVGAYQLEGVGIHLFERVVGAHSTILGLPLLPVLGALRTLRALTF